MEIGRRFDGSVVLAFFGMNMVNLFNKMSGIQCNIKNKLNILALVRLGIRRVSYTDRPSRPADDLPFGL